MIEVKGAVKIAVDYLRELYGQLEDEMLEEVSLSDDEKYWYVTLGFSRPIFLKESIFGPTPGAMTAAGVVKPIKYQREYKIFQIDSATGKVRSMKIRAA